MSNSHSVTSKDSGIQLLQSDSGAATGGPGSESGKTSSSTSSSMSLSHRLASLNLTGGGGGGGTGGGSGEKSGGGSVRGTLVSPNLDILFIEETKHPFCQFLSVQSRDILLWCAWPHCH